MFADGVKMYMKIINDVDLILLQCALNSLAEWACQWQLAISIDTCCILNIGKHVSSPHLSLDNCALPIVSQTKDLGVVVSNNLSPSTHVNDIAARAHKRANMIIITYLCLTRCNSSSCLSCLCQVSFRVQHSCLVIIYHTGH